MVLREGYHLALLRQDLPAAITVAIVALPLSMAIAIASGVGPERGLFAAIVGGFLISALGGSRFQIGGPGRRVHRAGGRHGREAWRGRHADRHRHGGPLHGARRLAAHRHLGAADPASGGGGFYRRHRVDHLREPAAGPVRPALSAAEPAAFLPKLATLWQAAGTFSFAAIVIAALAIAAILLLKRVAPKAPGLLVAVAGAAILAWLLHLPVETIGTRFGGVPHSLPAPGLPDLSWQRLAELLPTALSFALLGAIESLLSAVVADGMTGRRHRSNSELFAQGVANIGSALFGGLCVTGTIARTATNVKAGARTPVSGMLHAVIILLVLLVAAPLVAYIPLAALAAVLVTVAWNMLEWPAIVHMLRHARGAAVVLFITLAVTLLHDLMWGIIAGTLLALILQRLRAARERVRTRS